VHGGYDGGGGSGAAHAVMI